MLKSIFQKAADIAFKVLGDVKIPVTIKTIYDDGISVPIITLKTVNAIREEFKQDDFRGLIFRDLIQPYDMKLIILCKDINNIDTNDTIYVDSLEYSVFGVTKDAADTIWIVGVR